jgi:hypothetical protein
MTYHLENLLEVLKKDIPNITTAPKHVASVSSRVQKASNEIAKIPTYVSHIPINDMSDILNKYGLVLIDDDGAEFEGILTGKEGNTSIDLMDSFNNNKKINHSLIISWYKMEKSGKFEVVAYVA